ncbi:hypothetical protein FRB91_000582 [Serendipita sp. 411]|nr:hypothetical protein FRB91_000582 [Serendipita sp. 411]
MFKGVLKEPKRASSQDLTRNTTFIDALGTSGITPPQLPFAEPRVTNQQPDTNKENRPATVKAELFVNLAASKANRSARSSPTKRASTVLPPSVNLAMQLKGGDDANSSSHDSRPQTRSRSATVDPQKDSPPDPVRRRTESGSGLGAANPQGWGFEFLNHAPPISKEEQVEVTTHTEFDKMLDDLQIPNTLRPKLKGLETPVKAAMLRSSQVLTIPPPSGAPQLPSEPSSSPTKSKFGKDKEKTQKGAKKEKDKFKTENFSESKQHAPNPFMFNRNGNGSGKSTPKKGLRRTQSGGSLGDTPVGIPYSQMSPGGNGSSYNLGLGAGQEQALQFMFPSLEDPFARPESPPLMPPPNIAQLQNGYGGHLRGNSFDSGSGLGRPSSLLDKSLNLGSQSTLYLHGTGSSSGLGTSNGSGSASGSRNGAGGWGSPSGGLSMGLGNQSRPRVGSGANGQAILVKDRAAGSKDAVPGTVREREWTPGRFSTMLSQTKSIDLEVERLKKLRIMLRNEAASWSESFLIEGGYSALLARLNEMLEVEWREEQRDDQILHELLRCFKALSTSSIGQFALRSSAPRPFVQLVSLLYSDKKPGDACSRILMVELLIILIELYPSSAQSPIPERPSSALGLTTTPRLGTTSLPVSKSQYPLPAPHNNIFSLMRAILLTPKPLPSECPSMPISPHAFIESLHHPRIYKSYLKEVSDVCRDYFWIFCHPTNGIWDMDAVDIAKVEAPRAPGGMTGGVEFEAMNYLTTHFKLLNGVGRAAAELDLPSDHELSASKYHHDLFMSGMERIVAISRKASTMYYPTLHLEIARYIQLVRDAGMELPFGLQRMVAPPPSNLCKPEYEPKASAHAAKPVPKDTRHSRGASAAPVLPSVAMQQHRGNPGPSKGP